MPLDHYISQVHLKNFYSPMLGDLMYAIRKSDLKEFTPNAESICRIDDGSSNEYLRENRIVEEFLKSVEPKYNKAVSQLESGDIDQECIYVIAGFVAYVHTCSPTGMRIGSGFLKSIVEETAKGMDRQGVLPPPPPELGGESLSELIENEAVKVEIDQKYPQAIGISSIINFTQLFGNFHWEVLFNQFDDSPFFTSDYPIALEETADPRVHNKIIPLKPNLAIRICPDISLDKDQLDFSFSRFTYKVKKLNRDEVRQINKLIVRSAEALVFYSDNNDWVLRFVERNANYRIESQSQKIPKGRGFLHLTTQRIVELTD